MEQQSRFELVMALMHSGWAESDQLQSSDCYRPVDSELEFTLYGCSGSGFFQEYLLCLLQADAFFAAGLPAIYHRQIKTYYVCMLTLLKLGTPLAQQSLKSRRPDMPAAAYKSLIREADPDRTSSSNKKQSTVSDQPESSSQFLGEEDEVNLLASRKPTSVAGDTARPAQARARGRGRGGGGGRQQGPAPAQKRRKTESQIQTESQSLSQAQEVGIEIKAEAAEGEADAGQKLMIISSSDEEKDHENEEMNVGQGQAGQTVFDEFACGSGAGPMLSSDRHQSLVDPVAPAVPCQDFQNDAPGGAALEPDATATAGTTRVVGDGHGARSSAATFLEAGDAGDSSKQETVLLGTVFESNDSKDACASSAAAPGGSLGSRDPGVAVETSTAHSNIELVPSQLNQSPSMPGSVAAGAMAMASEASSSSGSRAMPGPGPSAEPVEPNPKSVTTRPKRSAGPEVPASAPAAVAEPSSILNLSTVWLANDIPVIKRSDKGVDSWLSASRLGCSTAVVGFVFFGVYLTARFTIHFVWQGLFMVVYIHTHTHVYRLSTGLHNGNIYGL